MTNGDVDIRSKFRLDLTPRRAEFYDTIDYAGAGDDIADFTGVIRISGPNGLIYENTDFDNPDIDPDVSRQSQNLITLPVDPQNDYMPYHGTYTVKYTIRDNTTQDTYEQTFIYGFQFDVPTMSLEVTSGPFTAQLRSQDLTSYGSDIDTLTRVHTLHYPEGILPSPPADIVTSLADHTVDPSYNNLWEITVATRVVYKQAADDLEYEWYGEVAEDHCVYGYCLTEVYTALDIMFLRYLDYSTTNPAKATLYRERFIKVNAAFTLLDIAWRNSDYEQADKQIYVIQDQISLSGINICSQGGSSDEVTPCGPWDGSGVTPPSYTFTSGLTEAAGVVRLGGTLTQDATVLVGAHSFQVNAVDSGNTAQVQVSAAGGVHLEGSDDSYRSFIDLTPAAGGMTFDYKDLGTPANDKGYALGPSGLVEDADYSADYSPRTLVSKGYMDSNQDWGSQTVVSDATLSGVGTSGSPLVVAAPFPGFSTLADDYSYSEPTHAFSEITAKPTTIVGYGITDAVTTLLGLSDFPSDYTGHGGKLLAVKATVDGVEFVSGAGFVPSTGGTFTGQVTIFTTDDYPLVIQQENAGESSGVLDASINRVQFQDNHGEVQGYIGMDGAGNLTLLTNFAGQKVQSEGDFDVQGDISVTGAVDGIDINQFYTDYGNHSHAFSSLTAIPTELSGYGITDAMLNTDNSWSAEFLSKGAAIAADKLVIEDSTASGEKKYIAVGALPSSAQTYLALSDTASSYSGQKGYIPQVNTGETALEFVDFAGLFISVDDGTLNIMSEKSVPALNDIILIEDSADGYAQKKALLSNITTGAGGQSEVFSEFITDATTTNIIVGNTNDHRGIKIIYTLSRGSSYQTGELVLLNRGGTMGVDPSYFGDDCGETFDADTSGLNIRINVTLSSTGTDASMEYIVIYPDGANAWSGPGAVLSSTTLIDDATTNVVIGDTTNNRAIKVIYSMQRDTLYQTGEIIVLNKGGTVSQDPEYFGDDCGLTVDVDTDSGNIRLNMTLSSTGDDADFEYILIYPDYLTVASPGAGYWERAGTVLTTVNAGDHVEVSGNILVDAISERTTDAGVTVDGVELKDGEMSIDYLGDPTQDHTISFAAHKLTWQFTNPAGGLLYNWKGAASGHLFELRQDTGVPSAGTHLLHIEATSGNVELFHLQHASATYLVLEVSVDGDASYRMQMQADGKMLWGNGTDTGDTNLYRSAANVLTTDDSMEVGTTLFTDIITELTPDAGVTIEGVELKDSDITLGTIGDKLIFGDGDTYIQEVADDEIQFFVGGFEKLRFDVTTVGYSAHNRPTQTSTYDLGLIDAFWRDSYVDRYYIDDTSTYINNVGGEISFTDPVTGTKTLAQLAASGYWNRSGTTDIVPTTSGDNLLLASGEAIHFGDTGTNWIIEFPNAQSSNTGIKWVHSDDSLSFLHNDIETIRMELDGGYIDIAGGSLGLFRGKELQINEINANVQNDLLISAAVGHTTHPDGHDVSIYGGDAYGTGDNDGGNVYLYGGLENGTGARGDVFIGYPSHPDDHVHLRATGAAVNVDFLIQAKGGESLFLGNSYANLASFRILNQSGYVELTNSTSQDAIYIHPGSGGGNDVDGAPLKLYGGSAGIVGDSDGGDVFIYGGPGYGSGVRGDVYLGDGSSILGIKEDIDPGAIVGIDTTTGLLTYNDLNVKTAEVTLNQSQIQGLNTTPIVLVSNSGSGSYIEVISCSAYYNYDTTVFVTGTYIRLKYNGNAIYPLRTSTNFIGDNSDRFEVMYPDTTSNIVVLNNNSLQITADADSTGGSASSTIKVIVTYRILSF